MASEQSMTQTIMQAVIKAAKGAMMADKEAEISANTTRPALAMPKNRWSNAEAAFTFNCKTPDKYIETHIALGLQGHWEEVDSVV